ncbi:MAG: DEAD/DEAH box helicase, partial [Spirochaetia bacterium]|nr:DEAD/DEAH box helicase [Spirochaetia bacterium]
MSKPLEVLRRVFGYDAFYPLQERVISQVLKGKDALVLMPTGGGKSLCFQIPALCREGLTLVVSPLVALQRDQVEALKANGVPAALLNSTQSYQEAEA